MANVQAFIEPFGGGNKSYFAQLEIFVNTVSRSIQADGGSDDVPLGVTINAPMLLLSGDVVYFELSTLHEQFTGVSGYQYKISMTRSASV